MDNTKLLDAAISYARRGWPVFPCHTPTSGGCSCASPKCENVGKHPRTPRGFKDAGTAEEQIKAYWQRVPDANIGIPTGAVSGLVVLDIDSRHAGDETLFDLVATHGTLPETVEVVTGGGGRHLFFEYPGRAIKSSSGQLGPGLDVRGDGGYVIAPESRHASGRHYEWESSSAPDDVDLAPIPPWLLKLLDSPTPAPAPGEGTWRAGEPILAGQRNFALTSLAGSMRRRNMSATAIEAALMVENEARCSPPLPEHEVRAIAGSVGRYPGGGGISLNGNHAGSVPVEDIHETDLGNARRLVANHGNDIRYSFAQSTWYIWDNTRWVADNTGEVQRRAKLAVGQMYNDAAQVADPATRAKLAKHAVASESKSRIEAMVDLAKSEPGIAVTPTALDSDPWLLNCTNGTLDLRTGILREHRRADLITMSAAVPYLPHARLDLWEDFIADIVDGDPDFAEYLQRTAGASLSGILVEFIFFAYGKPLTGKTTYLQALGGVLGDYCKTADFETFLKRPPTGGPRSDLARLRGARLVKAVEVGDGRSLAEGLLKLITGGDTLTVRDMYAKEFEYQPQFTLWLAANDAPAARNDDDALWRRLKRLPFVHEFSTPDETIKAQLTDQVFAGPAILRWAVQGCLAWQREGFEVPAAVRASTDEYKQDSDPLAEFLEAKCVESDEATVAAREFYLAYRAYADDAGMRRDEQLTSTRFGRLVAKRYAKTHTRGGRVYQGVGLRGVESQGGF